MGSLINLVHAGQVAYKALKSLHELALDCDAFVRLNDGGPPRPNLITLRAQSLTT